MPAATFAVPLLPGTTDAWLRAVEEMMGPRRAEWEESLRRKGITRDFVSLQRTPAGDFVVVYIEGDDPDSLISQYLSSDDPFDHWFNETILVGTAGIDPSQEPPPPNQVFIDWRA